MPTPSKKAAGAFLSVTGTPIPYRGPFAADVTLRTPIPRAPKRLDSRIVPDSKWPGMYRVRLPAGGLSDMVNLMRAKNALRALDETRCIDRLYPRASQ